jgi:hypothetical protein
MLGVVYSPPGISAQEGSDLIEHIIDSLDQVCSAFPDCGIVITGDFNMLNVADLLSSHNLKQVVREPTRGNNILDLIITNMFHFYSTPTVTAPLGRSDHHVINWSRNTDSAACLIKKGITKRKVHALPSHPVRRLEDGAVTTYGFLMFSIPILPPLWLLLLHLNLAPPLTYFSLPKPLRFMQLTNHG